MRCGPRSLSLLLTLQGGKGSSTTLSGCFTSLRRSFHEALDRSGVDPASGEYAENKAHMDQLVQNLRTDLHRISKGGGEEACNRAIKRGKLLVRDRINQLLDPGKYSRRSK